MYSAHSAFGIQLDLQLEYLTLIRIANLTIVHVLKQVETESYCQQLDETGGGWAQKFKEIKSDLHSCLTTILLLLS